MPGYEARTFSHQEKLDFQKYPQKHLDYRRTGETDGNAIFPLFLTESQQQQQAMAFFGQGMTNHNPDADLQEELVPKWNVGCRRRTLGTSYLEALSDPKFSIVYGEITNITTRGPVTKNGREHPVDVLVCATGFDTTFKPRFPLKGPHGVSRGDKWATNPEAYLGMAAAGFPDYFMYLGQIVRLAMPRCWWGSKHKRTIS
ncbi:hypothetical protein LTR10_024336 [Elasticomyces elasticus]|uniref:Monooxygenase n=1 Tax=Exophiala sideris TaxID=1016849 RepID=A0ABR0IUK1_9EURO|nr:hypothetical protein LTR10_024336 [Elasticomyces elasticus]KAK5020713.1 hypothetical protein LTS07_011471 [Exophiala sideris]KAK5022703.1 hypothetical protein LTR13_011429 [Exophiala sideris]KAK5048101.1 hypothetical protein LTR69_011464 [Exophiala sideris]KAK5175977.1 hypothetical protein LTR44_011463 [Eurotiomycetes sp. CCFEE 6388]